MLDSKTAKGTTRDPNDNNNQISPPSINLPKGGGAIRGMGEKFAANPVTGTGSMSVPIATSPGRSGFGPQLSLSYDSGSGNGPFGLGWNLSLPSISCKTDKGLPLYRDLEESDVFLLSGAEDLVPVINISSSVWPPSSPGVYQVGKENYLIKRFRPRVEGLFALIERWTDAAEPQKCFWRTISRDNMTTWYGRTADSRICDPDDPTHIFQWLLCEIHDDKGNVAVYDYLAEDSRNIDSVTAHEANRNKRPVLRSANRYLHRIRYGNIKPYLPSLTATEAWPSPDNVSGQKWMFEVVFDYGQCDLDNPAPMDNFTWPARPDAFSSHRAGFEIRTYRLCKQVLMFHHFPELDKSDYLVRSTVFTYQVPNTPNNPTTPGYTVLASVSHWSQQWDADNFTYQSRQRPPVEFTYSEPHVDQTLHIIDPAQLENLPVGIQGSGYQWIDLDGEGLSGVLTEQGSEWHYKPSLGDGTFGPMCVVAQKPAMAALAAGRQQLLDLAGDGQIDLVEFSGPTPGFHERDSDEGWKRHVPFASLPNIDWADPNLRFVDLTGDGHADALITEDEVFTWYPSLDERGFGPAEQSRQAIDEEAGPRIVFADGTLTIFLADMCGDGLTDLVRIRNGEVCYWPNLGYGRFGARVTLDNSPNFDHPDLYDPRRIRLADIDGSGPVDLIYLGRDGARLYFNRSGNSLSDPQLIPLPVATENLAAVQVVDLLGNGTACLVWNSHLPADTGRPVYYIDLMAGERKSEQDEVRHRRHEKPHLLIGVNNNLGGSTEIEYTPSTRFYIADKLAGTPWITRLPFPVHCVSRITVQDKWRRTAFSSTYSYHHGYFDGIEREFRGFGRVEQVDVEDYGKFEHGNVDSPYITADHNLYQPPVNTVTWYHTGAALDRQRILGQFAHEYFPQRFADRLPDPADNPTAFYEKPLPDPELPAGLDAHEWREALRACKGMVLRQEIYELNVDDLTGPSPKQTPVRLFSAATHNCNIQLLQSRGDNKHAVFLVTESEAISYHYELDLRGNGEFKPDPRIAHTLNLRHDEFGNQQQSVAIGYGRWQPGVYSDLPRLDLIKEVQAELHIAYSETLHTQDVIFPLQMAGSAPVRHHRLRLPYEVLTYELKGISKVDAHYYNLTDFRVCDLSETYGHRDDETAPPNSVHTRLYHECADGTARQKRIVEHARTRYFDDNSDLAPPDHPLAFGQHGPRGLKYEDYKLALTTDLLDAVFTQVDAASHTDDMLSWEVVPAQGDTPARSARDLLDDIKTSGYWPGPRIGMHPSEYWMRSGIAGFASDAHEHFFLPERYTDPFDNKTWLEYGNYDFFVQSTRDALGNTASVERFDYRILAPVEMLDPNGNFSEVAVDILGMVVAAAIKGKEIAPKKWEGDDLSYFNFALCNPSPVSVQTFCTNSMADRDQARQWLDRATTRFAYHFGETRDAHDNVIAWADRMAGACGIVREIHVGQLGGDTSPLQISLECSDGTGNVLMKKVQAEPETPGGPLRWIVNGLTVLNNKGKSVRQYEPVFTGQFGCEWPQDNGFSTTTYYDSAGRVERVEMPDGTFSQVEFSPWYVKSYDANDTILDSQWYRERLTTVERGPHAPAGSPDDEQKATAALAENKRAARLAAQHANTPTLTLLDSLGRNVISIAHNRSPSQDNRYSNTPLIDRPWLDERYLTFTKLDAEGKPLWIRDARDNLVMQYIRPYKPTRKFDEPDQNNTEAIPAGVVPCYDIAGNLLFQHSMDAGDSWMLMDAAGKPMLAWDVNDKGAGTSTQKRIYRTDYDALHRPTRQWLKIDAAGPALIEAFEYCGTNDLGALSLSDAQRLNLIGQAVKHWDPSGMATIERIDLCGKPAHLTRTLVKVKSGPALEAQFLDWNVTERDILLETETFIQITEYDALGRMTRLYNWHRDITFKAKGSKPVATPGKTNRAAVYEPTYNERGVLVSELLHVRATKVTDPDGCVSFIADTELSRQAIKAITYNAKGQKLTLELGNGTAIRYTYDDKTFRLTHLYTRRDDRFPDDCATDSDAARPARPCGVQNLDYTYDPVGNITHIQDDAQQTIYFANSKVEPSNDYTYDAFYRLVEATGRENAAAVAPPRNYEDPWPTNGFPSANALRNYIQRYSYDSVGNFVEMRHLPSTGSGWTRHYTTQPDSNRLDKIWYGGDTINAVTYHHDAHGNMLNLNRVETPPPLDQEEKWGLDLRWDWRDMIRGFDLGGGGIALYHYGIDKQRTRKHITRIGAAVEDRIYLGGYELYRRYNGNGGTTLVEEIESHHLFEGEQRVLLVDDVILTNKTHADHRPCQTDPIYRYQYSNHLGSASLELDDQAQIISYEEYHPYGTSAYRSMKSGIEASPKRYRYTGMERDEESGLNYHGARYYAPWLGRWTTCDPLGPANSGNLYLAFRCSPPCFTDPTGGEDKFEPNGVGYRRREFSINVDESLPVGESGISHKEAMRRACDMDKRQLLEAYYNQGPKNNNVEFAPNRATSFPRVSLKDQPGAIFRPQLGGIKEWDEMSSKILKEKLPTLKGKSPGDAKKLLNKALIEEMKNPRTVAGKVISEELESQLGRPAKELFSADFKSTAKWGQTIKGAKFKGLLTALGLAVTLISLDASASEFNVKSPAQSFSDGEMAPMTMTQMANLKNDIATQVGNITSISNVGVFATLLCGYVSLDSSNTKIALNMAKLNLLSLPGNPQLVENAPYVIDPSSGKVYGIDLDGVGSDKGALRLLGIFEKGFGAGSDYFKSAQNVFYQTDGKWFLGQWGK